VNKVFFSLFTGKEPIDIWDADSSPYAFKREKNKPHCLTRCSGMAAFSFRASAWWWKQRAVDCTSPGIGGVVEVLQS